MSETLEDKVNHPNHYCKFNVELESIDVVDRFCFNLGSLLKYALRYRDKGNPVMDLQKALFYAKRLQGNEKKKQDALMEICNNKALLEIFRDKSWDAVTKETINYLLNDGCMGGWSFLEIINLLENRLAEEMRKSKDKE